MIKSSETTRGENETQPRNRKEEAGFKICSRRIGSRRVHYLIAGEFAADASVITD